MGTALTGLVVGSTYNGLLKTKDNAVLDGDLRVITDGFGNDSALQLSTAGVASSGTLSVTGASTLAALSATTGAFSSTLSVAGAISGAGFTALFASPPAIGGTTPAAGAFTSLSATIGFTTNGLIPANQTSSISVEQLSSTVSRILAWGPDTSTPGQLQIGVISSNASAGANPVATFASTGLAVTGTLSATGEISGSTSLKLSGALSGLHTSALSLDQLTATRSRLAAWGSNALTPGTFEVASLSSDGSTNVTVATFSSTGLAVTGVGSFTGNLTSTGLLTLGSGPTTVSDSAGKILSAALNTVAIAQGGTGATSASSARTALGLAIGSDVQAYSSVLSTYAGITPSANVQTLLGSASFSAFRTSLGVAIGADVQAYDADLSALAALSGTNTIYYRSASNTWSAVTIGSNLTFSGGTLSAASGGGGTIGGSTGATDNRLIRADGTGGSTVQSSGITIDDSDNVTGAATMDVGTGGYKVSGTKVLGAQQAAESDIALLTAIGGFDQVDATDITANFGDLNNKINSILAKLRAHGIIAT